MFDVSGWSEQFRGNNPIDRLAAAIFVGSTNPGARLMGMFTAYFDAAGNAQEQPFVIVAGYIANFFQWGTFEHSWKEAHSRYGLQLPFHMATFMAAQTNKNYVYQKNARQDYISIAADPDKSHDFLKTLCIAQATVVNCAVSCTVPMDVYKGVSSLLELREVIPPYALAARTCIGRIRKWEKYFGVEEPVECIFEEGDFEQGKFSRLMVDEGMDLPIYKKKVDFAGLQAADQYAWEQYSYRKEAMLSQAAVVRKPFQLLLEAIPRMYVEPTTATLINLCHQKGIDPKTGIQHEKTK